MQRYGNLIHNTSVFVKKYHITDNIKFLRAHTGLSQDKFGALFSVSRDNVASYERGSVPNFDTISAIVSYFHMSYDDFISSPLTEENFKTKSTKNVLKQNEDKNEDVFEDKRKVQKTSSNAEIKVYERDPRDVDLIAAQKKTIASLEKNIVLQERASARDEEEIASLRQRISDLENASRSRGLVSARSATGKATSGTYGSL